MSNSRDLLKIILKNQGQVNPVASGFSGMDGAIESARNGVPARATALTFAPNKSNFTMAESTHEGGTSTPPVTPPVTPTFEYDNQRDLDDALKTAMGDWKGYDINADPFYQQMVDRYTKNAKMGMEDAIGRAVALTGGYGNSYAQSVGQQAYYNQMDGLNDLALDLYNNAYQRWRDKKNDAWNYYEYYAADKAAKEKQWMIDNGLISVDDGNLSAEEALKEWQKIEQLVNNIYNEEGGGTEGYNAVTNKLYDLGYTDEDIMKFLYMWK